MIRRPPRSTRTDTLFPYTTLFRSRRDLLGHPGRRRTRGRCQGIAEYAGRGGENEGADAGIHRFFEQVQRAGDIGVDEILPAVGRDMGLMQRGRVIDGPDAAEAVAEPRSEGRRVGQEWVRTCRLWWSPYH